MKKEKIIISLVAILMITFATQNIISLATEGNGNKVTITAQTGNNTVNQAKNETVNDAVGAVNKVTNNANKVTNKNETNTANNVVNNTTNKLDNKTTNTESKTKLPKAGTDSTVIFLVLGFVASAIYAYKKVSDYNV